YFANNFLSIKILKKISIRNSCILLVENDFITQSNQLFVIQNNLTSSVSHSRTPEEYSSGVFCCPTT
ncbi:TPA: hypothetical protein ACQQME_001152, partial [Enterococcus hirae]